MLIEIESTNQLLGEKETALKSELREISTGQLVLCSQNSGNQSKDTLKSKKKEPIIEKLKRELVIDFLKNKIFENSEFDEETAFSKMIDLISNLTNKQRVFLVGWFKLIDATEEEYRSLANMSKRDIKRNTYYYSKELINDIKKEFNITVKKVEENSGKLQRVVTYHASRESIDKHLKDSRIPLVLVQGPYGTSTRRNNSIKENKVRNMDIQKAEIQKENNSKDKITTGNSIDTRDTKTISSALESFSKTDNINKDKNVPEGLSHTSSDTTNKENISSRTLRGKRRTRKDYNEFLNNCVNELGSIEEAKKFLKTNLTSTQFKYIDMILGLSDGKPKAPAEIAKELKLTSPTITGTIKTSIKKTAKLLNTLKLSSVSTLDSARITGRHERANNKKPPECIKKLKEEGRFEELLGKMKSVEKANILRDFYEKLMSINEIKDLHKNSESTISYHIRTGTKELEDMIKSEKITTTETSDNKERSEKDNVAQSVEIKTNNEIDNSENKTITENADTKDIENKESVTDETLRYNNNPALSLNLEKRKSILNIEAERIRLVRMILDWPENRVLALLNLVENWDK